MIKVLFVCFGNICRSPMAEFIFKDIVKNRKLQDKFLIDSAATSEQNEKNKISIYCEAKYILEKNNIPFYNRISKQIKKDDYCRYDYILAMEDENIKNIMKIIEVDDKKKVYRLLDFTENPRDIIDPWYYGNFDATYDDIKFGCEKFLEYVLNNDID
ncbi:MAG: low molecular weight phosphotyrosine protein phosphatase [Bacilli bacterium]|nr:low molecular weight phosphotyrosine protein phosphatase [Bacilli bacterium]